MALSLKASIAALLAFALFGATAVRADEACTWLDVDRADRVAGPYGIEVPRDAVARVDCPIAAELLRPLEP